MDIRNSGEIFLRVYHKGKPHRHPLQAFSFSYSLNQIPIATCRLNTGLSLRSGDPAPLHSASSESFSEMNRAEIVANIQGPFNSRAKKRWDDIGEVVLFEGRVSGVTPALSRPSLSVEVTLVHWLSDLAFSAALSEQVGHGTHSSLALRSIYVSSAAGTETPSFIGNYSLHGFMESTRIEEDLWGSSLHPMLLKLTENDPLVVESGLAKCEITPGTDGNEILRSALKRFDGARDGRTPRSDDYAPLAIKTDSAAVAESIGSFVTAVVNESMGGRSMWEKLLELAGPLGFSIIPMVDHAMVAPVTLGLRSTYAKKLKLQDVSVIQPERWNVRPIRSSLVLAGRISAIAGLQAGPESKDSALLDRSKLVGGCYVPDKGPARGLVLVNTAPAWLNNVPAFSDSPSRSSGHEAGVPGTASSKAKKDDKLRGGRDGKTPADVLSQAQTLYSTYARYLYVQEILNNRNLLVVCPTLRVDIAPGSSVEIEGPFDEPLFGGRLFGTVARVTLSVQASLGGLQLSTQFRLAGIRRDEENSQDAFSVDAHPLYAGRQFLGTPLRDDFKFEE